MFNRGLRATSNECHVDECLLDDTIVNISQNVMYLGVVLDTNVNYHRHIEHVTHMV